MTTILLVRGTGVRQPVYDTISPVHPRRSAVSRPAAWGDEHGSKFAGSDLPGYASEAEQQDLALGGMLLQSPFGELALLEAATADDGLSQHEELRSFRPHRRPSRVGSSAESACAECEDERLSPT